MAQSPARREWEERKKQLPDKWTLAWWNEKLDELAKGYRGATHGINRCLADFEDVLQKIQKLEARCAELERERDEAAAEVGALRADLVAMNDRIDRMAEWLKANVSGES